MQHTEQEKSQTNQSTPYQSAKHDWDCYGRHDENRMTSQAIFVTIRLALTQNVTPDERHALQWMCRMGETLEELSLYEPE